jgi:hypothetical protein
MKKKPPLKFPKANMEFKVPIYGGDVLLYRSEARLNQLLKYLKRPDEELSHDMGGTCRYMENNGYALYVIGWHTKNNSTIVHECGHLAAYILKRAGVDDTGGEAFCYLLEYLVRRFGIDSKPRAKPAKAKVLKPAVAWMRGDGRVVSDPVKRSHPTIFADYDIPLYE